MSLYNLVAGISSIAPYVLEELKLKHTDFDRIRDAFVASEPELHLVVLTRCGGGNRESYQDLFDKMSQHPLYISNEDDSFDSTFAYFRFKFPENSELLTQVKEAIDTLEKEGTPAKAFEFCRNGNRTVEQIMKLATDSMFGEHQEHQEHQENNENG